MRKNSNASKIRFQLNGWAFVVPSIVLFFWLTFWPMVNAFIMSLQKGKGSVVTFAGLENYKRLLSDPMFISTTKNTILYLLVQVPIMLLLALVISSMLNNPRLKGRGFFRTAIFVPCVTSLVAYSLLFKSMFAVDGIVNKALLGLGIIEQGVPWLLHPVWAKVVIIAAITWRWTGYNMIFYLSSMQNIDGGVYEAAEIDGAGAFQKFRYITVPLLKPVILLTGIMSTTGTLQIFDEVVNITNGGPANSTMSISQYIYNLSFKYAPDFGYSATVSYAIFFMVAVLSLIQMKVSGDKDE
jgi:lactose/L-arabinose transport system permease protein